MAKRSNTLLDRQISNLGSTTFDRLARASRSSVCENKPPYNEHLSTTDASPQRTPLQRTPLYNEHLSTTDTSLERTPLHNGQ